MASHPHVIGASSPPADVCDRCSLWPTSEYCEWSPTSVNVIVDGVYCARCMGVLRDREIEGILVILHTETTQA